jgi:hypothetical protein
LKKVLKWMEKLSNKEASTMATMILAHFEEIPEPFHKNFHVAVLKHVDTSMKLLEEIRNRGVILEPHPSKHTLPPKPSGQGGGGWREGASESTSFLEGSRFKTPKV